MERVKAEIEESIGLDCSEALPVSAKTGMGVDAVLEAIVKRLPAPRGNPDAPIKAASRTRIFGSTARPRDPRNW